MQVGGASPRLTATGRDDVSIVGGLEFGCQMPCQEKLGGVRKPHEPDLEGLRGWVTIIVGLAQQLRVTLTWHLALAVILTLPGGAEVQMHVMVDSGATVNFMDIEFTTKWGIPQHEVAPAILVETIDG